MSNNQILAFFNTGSGSIFQKIHQILRGLHGHLCRMLIWGILSFTIKLVKQVTY